MVFPLGIIGISWFCFLGDFLFWALPKVPFGKYFLFFLGFFLANPRFFFGWISWFRFSGGFWSFRGGGSFSRANPRK